MICLQCHKKTSENARHCAHCNTDLRPATHPARRGPISCTTCAEDMEIVNVDGVEIDVCPHCAAVWLDRGELERLTTIQAATAFSLLAVRPSTEGAAIESAMRRRWTGSMATSEPWM